MSSIKSHVPQKQSYKPTLRHILQFSVVSLTSCPGIGDRERWLTLNLLSLSSHPEHIVVSGRQRRHPVCRGGEIGCQGAPCPCAGLQGLDGVSGLLSLVRASSWRLPCKPQSRWLHLFNLWAVDGSWDFCEKIEVFQYHLQAVSLHTCEGVSFLSSLGVSLSLSTTSTTSFSP